MCRTISQFIAVLIFYNLIVCVTSQKVSNLACPSPRLLGRMEAVDPGDAEIGKRVLKDAVMIKELRNIQMVFENIDKRSNNTRCRERQEHGLKNVREVVSALNLDTSNNDTNPVIDDCVTKVDFPRDNQRKEQKDSKLFADSLTRFENGFAAKGLAALKAISSKLIPKGKWPNPLPVGEVVWEKDGNYHTCTIHHANGYRVNGKWFFIAEITNAEWDVELGKRERLYYREMFHLEGENVLSYLTVRVRDTCNNNTTGKRGNAWIEAWDGKAHFSAYLTGDAEQDALAAVRDEIDGKETDVVMDSDTASNIAILLLPVGLALLPLSLFQDVGTGVTLLYVLFTDIISVLPVAIKGVELLDLAAREHNARTAYIYGSTNSKVVATEMWVSSCKLMPFVRTRGIVLLAVAFTAMFIGLVLEFVVRHRLEKYKEVNRSYLVKEWEIEERTSLEENRRSSVYSTERVVNFMQRGGSGGLLWHIEQAKEMGKELEKRESMERASLERASLQYERASIERTRMTQELLAKKNPPDESADSQ